MWIWQCRGRAALGRSRSTEEEIHTAADTRQDGRRGRGGCRQRRWRQRQRGRAVRLFRGFPTKRGLPSVDSGGTDRYGYCVDQGPRRYMEDAVDASSDFFAEGPGPPTEPTEFYAVYDGHGGSAAVEFVHTEIPRLLRCHEGLRNDRIQEALHEVFIKTDEKLLKRFREAGHEEGRPQGEYSLSSGCVACALLLRGTRLHIANLGDCRALLCKAGECVSLTQDHRAEVNDDERQRLEDLGVEVSADGYLHGRIAVSRAFGDWAWDAQEKCLGIICQPDVTETEVTDDTEFLLMASDGIFEKMPPKEAVLTVRRRLRTTRSPREAAETLIKNGIARKGSDNLSVMVVAFNIPPPVSSGSERSAPRLFAKRTAAPTLNSTASFESTVEPSDAPPRGPGELERSDTAFYSCASP